MQLHSSMIFLLERRKIHTSEFAHETFENLINERLLQKNIQFLSKHQIKTESEICFWVNKNIHQISNSSK